MSNYNPADRDQANLNPDVMYTHHGIKHMQGYPVKVFGQNALGYFRKGKLEGFTYQEEINKLFENPDIPNYEPLL